ncbi:hypothetical protein Xcc3_11120 [Xanthomonas campestris pv. campestris]|nr:hypothetical protein Xcc3_11120 [Xanthomonas campestris pv. campestris]
MQLERHEGFAPYPHPNPSPVGEGLKHSLGGRVPLKLFAFAQKLYRTRPYQYAPLLPIGESTS